MTISRFHQIHQVVCEAMRKDQAIFDASGATFDLMGSFDQVPDVFEAQAVASFGEEYEAYADIMYRSAPSDEGMYFNANADRWEA